MTAPGNAKVAIVMGSQSDWETMTCADEVLGELGVATDVRIVSAHRTPDRMYEFAKRAAADGFEVIIAGAGMAAAGWLAFVTIRWPMVRLAQVSTGRQAGRRAGTQAWARVRYGDSYPVPSSGDTAGAGLEGHQGFRAQRFTVTTCVSEPSRYSMHPRPCKSSFAH